MEHKKKKKKFRSHPHVKDYDILLQLTSVVQYRTNKSDFWWMSSVISTYTRLYNSGSSMLPVLFSKTMNNILNIFLCF